MPYTLRFYLYLLVSGVVALVGADLLSPLGLTVNIAFALVAGYLGIIVGRWVLGRKNL
jgi:membrane associated rhomboid family serine protease